MTSARTSTAPFGGWFAALLATWLVGACALLSPYDPTSYRYATELKAESLELLEAAVEPYERRADEVAQLKVRLRQAYEYERGKGGPNEETAALWKRLIASDGHLLGGLLNRWAASGQLGATFLAEITPKIESGFDEIIELERAKVKQ